MDAYDLGIKQRPCPAAAVNTTDWFFAVAYERNHPTYNGEADGSDYFLNKGEPNNTNFSINLTPATSLPKLFNEYGYTVSRSYFITTSNFPLNAGRWGDYTGSLQMSSWVSFASALNAVASVYSFTNGVATCPNFSLVNKGSGLAALRVAQTYTPNTYSVDSATFACPTNGDWFYLSLVIDCATGSVSVYIGASLVATISTRNNLFNNSGAFTFNGVKRDCIMRKWTAGDTIIVPTRLLLLA